MSGVEKAWDESGRSALDEMFEAITPRDGSLGDANTAAYLAPHAWAEIRRLRDAERRAIEAEGAAKEALDALQVAALGSYEERLMPEDTVADPYEAHKLVAVTQDYSGEYSCHWTQEGIDCVRTTIEKLRIVVHSPDQLAPVEGEAQEQVMVTLTLDEAKAIAHHTGKFETGPAKIRALLHSTTKDPER